MIQASLPIQHEQVADHYDELDRYYREIWGEHLHHGLWERGDETLLEAVRGLSLLVAQQGYVSSGSKVCDVGCGYGATAELLAETFGANVTGLTLSGKQLVVANSRHPARGSVDFHKQDWLENSLPASTYDTVIAIESTEHMRDKAKFFEQAFRVLKPGGRLVICAWSSSESPSDWQVTHLLEPICREGRLPSMLSPSEYVELARQNGFAEIEVEDLSKRVQRTWTVTLSRTFRHFLKNPQQIKDLSVRELPSADFAKSLLRINAAYRSGAMVYAIISATKVTV